MAGITIQEELVVKGIVSQEELQIPFRIGVDGVTFTPSVSAEGVISWTNDGDKENPTPINIKGQQGDNVEFRTSGGYVQWKPTSGTTWTNLISIAELAQLETTTGQSTTKGMTQKAITDELNIIYDNTLVNIDLDLSIPTYSGYYFNVYSTNKTSAQTASSGFNSHLVQVVAGDKYKGSATLGGSSMAMAIFYNSSGTKISHILQGDSTTHNDVLITVPIGATEMIFCWSVSGSASLIKESYKVGKAVDDLTDVVSLVKYTADSTKSETDDINAMINEISEIKNIYDYSSVGVVTGVITTAGALYINGFSTGLIPVKSDHFYYLSGRKSTAVGSIRCVAANGTTISKVRVASTGLEPAANIYYYLPKEDGSTYATNGQFKTSPNAAFIQISLTELGAVSIGNDYKIMLEEVGNTYNPSFKPFEYIDHKRTFKDSNLEYPVLPLRQRVDKLENAVSVKVLLIGSSHGMNTIGQFPMLAYNSGIDIICANAYQGSLSLQQVAGYCTNGGNFGGWYKKYVNGVWADFGVKTILQMLQDEQWDFISIQRSASEDMTWTAEQAGYLDTILAYITANCNYTPTIVFNSGFADSFSLANRAAQQADTNTIMTTALQVKTNYGIEVIPTAAALQAVRNNDTLAGLGSYTDKMLSCDSQHLDQGIGMYVTGCICFNFFLKHLKRSVLTCKYLPTIADMTPFWYDVTKFTAIQEQYAKEIRKIVCQYFANN